MNEKVRIRRIFAWIIDMVLSATPYVVFSNFFSEELSRPSIQNIGLVFLTFLLALLFIVTFFLRDVIFKGRSIGKRILRLYIYDNGTGAPAPTYKKFLCNLFAFAFPVDCFLLLITKKTIGDRITNTIVVKC